MKRFVSLIVVLIVVVFSTLQSGLNNIIECRGGHGTSGAGL